MDASGLTPALAARSDHPEPDRRGVPQSAEDLLRSVWDQTAPELARLVSAMGIDSERAEDVLQDVYLAGLQRPLPAGDEAGTRRWLFRVTVNRCHLESRRRVRWRKALGRLVRYPRPAVDRGEVAEEIGRREERAMVRTALERLDPDSRAVLVLRYFAELDSREIGRILKLPDSTVRSRLVRARTRLAAALRQAGYRDA